MTTQEIVQKLWNLCNVLRDDGITYQDYVTELTYILFLKMLAETDKENLISRGMTLATGDDLSADQLDENHDKQIILDYSWENLASKDGVELFDYYKKLLEVFGKYCTGRVQEIYSGSSSNIDEPANLKKIISSIDALDWYSARHEGLGDLYEGLLEKNANEKKSGAGQYFTPRVLIDIMTRLVAPKAGELCNDPACGTFGFMIAADAYVKSTTDDYFDLSAAEAEFQRNEAFTGTELVHDTHRLALMNAMLHGIDGKITLGDTLSPSGKCSEKYDVVLTNPPFGTKRGGERATRDDFTFVTSNKQLNFLQHIYRSLKRGGRAAVVLPDNVLFEGGVGDQIRVDLMEKCNLHTILRLPTGIFYAQGVKTNVLFFERGQTDKGNTQEIWFYDMRTNMRSFGKTHPLTHEDFAGFEAAYTAEDRHAVKDERWRCYTRDEIRKTDRNGVESNSLDLTWIKTGEDISEVSLAELLEDIREKSDEISDAVEQLESLLGDIEE